MIDPRRRIPSVDVLLAHPSASALLELYPRPRVVQGLRVAVAQVRDELGTAHDVPEGAVEAPEPYVERAAEWLRAADVPSLRSVINATGVVIHTNLGRAPLAPAVARAMTDAAQGYGNLEFDLESGARGSRYDHCVDLLCELTGAEDALVVNNCAAALLLMLNSAASGRGVVVSRGELVEIGGGFRIPEIMARSGAELLEVGSTNRTRIRDYEGAFDEGNVAALLKVHRSNFRITGFTEEADVADLAALGRSRRVPVIHDLGSGLFVPAELLGLPSEPTARDSIAAGVDAVTVSGDKLFGGPQAGMIVGSAHWIGRFRKNPMCRALRVDKVALAGLEATLRMYRDPATAIREIPTLRMLSTPTEDIRGRAEALEASLGPVGADVRVVETRGAVGGGTYPGVELPSWALSVGTGDDASEVAARLRADEAPVIGRVIDDRLLLDLRTVLPGEEARVAEALRRALGSVEA